MRLATAIAQINTTVADFRGNAALILDAHRRAAEAGADLVVYPELAIPGYPPLDLLYRDDFVESCESTLASLVPQLKGPAAVLGTVRRNVSGRGRPLFNSAAVIDDGRLVGFHDKGLLPTYDVFDEDRYFEPGKRAAVFELRGHRVGVAICEDLWSADETLAPRYGRDPVGELVEDGAQIVVCPSASPYHVRKAHQRRQVFHGRAQAHGIPLVVCNLVGGNTELIFDGGSLAVAPAGVIARAPLFEESLMVVDPWGAPISLPTVTDTTRLERIADALVLGLRDYFRKCGFRSAVIGLSGGIDSAVTAAVACAALGADAVRGVAMPSRYSSEGSLVDARELAERLKIRFDVVSIEPVFESYLTSLQPIFGEGELGVTEENLQARARGALLMAISNRFGDVVLSTGNKSELAVGYCTLYGDMCGGLSPLGDVSKTDVYGVAELARFRALIPESTRTKAPSAELRPNQTDQDSLPPYSELDAILESFVERHVDVDRIAAKGLDPALVREVVDQVERNEYKRRQAPPTLRVTSKAFGMGRRIPIARHLGAPDS